MSDAIAGELEALADEHGVVDLYRTLAELEEEYDDWSAARLNAMAEKIPDPDELTDEEVEKMDEAVDVIISGLEELSEE